MGVFKEIAEAVKDIGLAALFKDRKVRRILDAIEEGGGRIEHFQSAMRKIDASAATVTVGYVKPDFTASETLALDFVRRKLRGR